MRAIVSVLGHDRPGIIANVSNVLYECNVNILDISQTVLREELFAMTMLVDMEKMNVPFDQLKSKMDAVAGEIGMEIRVQREELFENMYRV
ncbi:MAG: ACT domain-containing protein [Christensenellaceae bacterium]